MSRSLLRDALWRQLALALAVMLVLLLLSALGVYGMLRAFEQTAWQGRQREAAEAAAETIEAFVERTSEAIRVAAVLDGDFLAEHPAALEDLLQQSDLILEILRVDAEGRALASAHRDAPLLAEQFTVPESRWFHEAVAGRRHLGGIQLSARAEPYVMLALPALDGGVVAARLRGEALWGAVEDFRFGEGGRAYVLDGEGRVVAHSDPRLSQVSLDGRPELAALRAAPEGRWRGSYTSFEGRDVVAASASVAGGEWWVLAELPRDEAERWSRQAWRWLSGTAAILGLLTLAMTAWLLAQLVWPLRLAPPGAPLPLPNASSASERTASHALDHTRPLSRSDVETLRASFDDMYHRVTDIDRLTGEFLATISHELRTPLNSVIGYAELILSGVNGPLDAEMQKDIEAIHENGHHLLRLVNDLLDLAKIEAGRLELELVRMDPAGLLIEAGEANARLVEQKGLSLSIDAEPDLPAVWADPVRLRQVLDSLISNAVKFTEEGGLRLGARQEGDWLALTVQDSGIGISEADRETIFERFRQLDGSFTRRAEGTGLGLAISRHLVRMHGGRITVDSQPGEGSTFTLLLPIEETPTHARGLAIGSLL